MNYYEELGIRSDADEEEIRKAHRRLVKLMHPDQHRDAGLKALAETQMRRLNSIVATLLDPDERREYDEQLRGGGGDPLNPPPPQSSWKAVPWWIASTLGAIILTVGTLWFFADRMGPTHKTASNPPPDVADIAPNDNPSTVKVPVPQDSVKAPDNVTTVTVPTPAQQVPNTTKSEEKKPDPVKPEPPKPEPPKPAPVVKTPEPVVKTPELAKATKLPEPLPKIVPPPVVKEPVVKEIVKKPAIAQQKLPAVTPPKQTPTIARLKPPVVVTHQPPPVKAPVITQPQPPTTVAVVPREDRNPVVSTPPVTPPVQAQPKEPVVIATANPPAIPAGSVPSREMSPPDIPKSTPPPSVTPSYHNNHDPLEGEWVYAPTEPEKRKPGLFPPQFIQFKLVKDPNGMHGQYSARYDVDKAVSPDVNFVVKATDPTAMKYIWTAPNGAHGWLMIVDLETDMMRLEWKDTSKHNAHQLTSGQATLVRKN